MHEEEGLMRDLETELAPFKRAQYARDKKGGIMKQKEEAKTKMDGLDADMKAQSGEWEKQKTAFANANKG